MLQSFQVLAKLPNPVNQKELPPKSASVHALVGGKKRKRSELAVAIDTEGISLYDVSIISPTNLGCPEGSDTLTDPDLQTGHQLFGLSTSLVYLPTVLDSAEESQDRCRTPNLLFCH